MSRQARSSTSRKTDADVQAAPAGDHTQASYDDLLMATYELREKLVADKHRPRYHFVPPEGRWNDLNGIGVY